MMQRKIPTLVDSYGILCTVVCIVFVISVDVLHGNDNVYHLSIMIIMPNT